ncbi:inositol monophosphatase family protein [Mesorhizobium sp. L-8-3]|uniref:inositol monophosphatase family protein n=1 Tax=Mesorhizobium sp. L-8-3 TaxID=2744522 RepID=UPI0019251763|nr:inositol monophosphatase [Mesorhizobium sp. L-8-3]BCH27896.1 arabinose phosphate phosphatase [Mesorhizobium sp. L-8-3]
MPGPGVSGSSSPAETAAILELIAHEAGELALRHFRERKFGVESKGYRDPVTEVDIAVERHLHDRLRQAFPDDGIIGEEGAAAASASGRYWLADPIDGTLNFIRGMDQWSVSIGLFEGGQARLGVVFLPAQGRILVGGKEVAPRMNGAPIAPLPPLDPQLPAVALGFGPASGQLRSAAFLQSVHRAGFTARVSGCGSASLVSVILGHVDGYLSLGESSWDVIGGMAILSALGARSNLSWTRDNLCTKRVFACGSEAFMATARPILDELEKA